MTTYYPLAVAVGLLLLALHSLLPGEAGRVSLIGAVVCFALAVVFGVVGK